MSVPYIIEKGPKDQERVYDLYSRLLKDRIIFIRGGFDHNLADSVVAQLLFLETNDPDKDIFMYINSPGGSVYDMYAIYDVMQYVRPDIVTVGIGTCMSAASFILAAGTKGKRYVLPNTEIMIHELSTGHEGKAGDLRVQYKHMERLYNKMAEHYVKFTGQPIERIKKDMERDHYMTPEEAIAYGLIDEVHKERS